MSPKFEASQAVRAKLDGTLMTIASVTPGVEDIIRCEWVQGTKPMQKDFFASELEHVNPPKSPAPGVNESVERFLSEGKHGQT